MFKLITVAIVAATLWMTAADEEKPAKPKSFYDFTVKDIDGKDVTLSKYRGNVCLVVNVASK